MQHAKHVSHRLCVTSDQCLAPRLSSSHPPLCLAEVSQLPAAQCSSAYQWQGVFKASKGRQDMAKANTVHTTMAVLRFPSVASDVLLVLSTPTQICSESSSAEHAGSGPQHRHHAAPALFLQILQSFAVKEWSLFGESAPV